MRVSTAADLKLTDDKFIIHENQSIFYKKIGYDLKPVSVYNVLFADIETVPLTKNYNELSPEMQSLWQTKYKKLISGNTYEKHGDESLKDMYSLKCGLYPEFGKIICISVSKRKYMGKDVPYQTTNITFQNDDEGEMLRAFAKYLETDTNQKARGSINVVKYIFGANLRGFDNAFWWRKFLMHGIHPPSIIYQLGRAKWDDMTIDIIQDVWKLGGFTNVGDCTFEAICLSLGVDSPKNGDVSGKDVGMAYYEGRIDQICTYCEADVAALVQCWDKLTSLTKYEYRT